MYVYIIIYIYACVCVYVCDNCNELWIFFQSFTYFKERRKFYPLQMCFYANNGLTGDYMYEVTSGDN